MSLKNITHTSQKKQTKYHHFNQKKKQQKKQRNKTKKHNTLQHFKYQNKIKKKQKTKNKKQKTHRAKVTFFFLFLLFFCSYHPYTKFKIFTCVVAFVFASMVIYMFTHYHFIKGSPSSAVKSSSSSSSAAIDFLGFDILYVFKKSCGDTRLFLFA